MLEVAVFKGGLPSEALLSGLAILVGITDISDSEILKMCLEFWKHFANEQFMYERNFQLEAQSAIQVGWAALCCPSSCLPRVREGAFSCGRVRPPAHACDCLCACACGGFPRMLGPCSSSSCCR